MKLYVSIMFVFLSFSPTQAQSREMKEYFNNGLFFYENGDYKEALYNFLMFHSLDTDNANINYKIAMCYFNLPGEELKSIPYLQRASRKISDTYREYSISSTSAPLHTLFFLGKAYRLSGDIDNALRVIKEFIASPYYVEYNSAIVERELQICKRAQVMMDNPAKINITNMGDVINNEGDNFSAVMSADGNSIVYVTNLKLYDAIFYSVKEDGKWKTPVNISSQVFSDGNMYPTSLSADGTELYLVKNYQNKTSDIVRSRLIDGVWTPAELLNSYINTKGNETHATISEDGTKLFFTSDSKGYGGLDIFLSIKNPATGDWGKAVNLGKNINSSSNENTPFITHNGTLLFFCSQNHYNMGEYDMFYSQLQSNGKWSTPVNLGYPINTTNNNMFYAPIENGRYLLIAKNLPEGYGMRDIYKVELLFDPFAGKNTSLNE
mgnify:CR=1 FL=1